jgi:hypothetical protein
VSANNHIDPTPSFAKAKVGHRPKQQVDVTVSLLLIILNVTVSCKDMAFEFSWVAVPELGGLTI